MGITGMDVGTLRIRRFPATPTTPAQRPIGCVVSGGSGPTPDDRREGQVPDGCGRKWRNGRTGIYSARRRRRMCMKKADLRPPEKTMRNKSWG